MVFIFSGLSAGPRLLWLNTGLPPATSTADHRAGWMKCRMGKGEGTHTVMTAAKKRTVLGYRGVPG